MKKPLRSLFMSRQLRTQLILYIMIISLAVMAGLLILFIHLCKI